MSRNYEKEKEKKLQAKQKQLWQNIMILHHMFD